MCSQALRANTRLGVGYQCSPQGMTGGQNLGGATGHIKAIILLPFPHQRKVCTEGLLGRHALRMLGRTLDTVLCILL